MEILEKLLGSSARVKILRLFLFNETTPYDIGDIMQRADVTKAEAKRELSTLEKVTYIKRRPFLKDELRKKGKKTELRKVKANGWVLDNKFPYLSAVKNLLITVSLHQNEDLIRRFARVGRVKLLVTAGVFMQDWTSRVDLLIVGDDIKQASVEKAIRALEAEIGKELVYSVFETTDFQYRLGIYDKLIRDILDFPHVKIVDKLGV